MKPPSALRLHSTRGRVKRKIAGFRILIQAIVGCAILLLALESFANNVNGKVVEVFSGDIFTIQIGDGKIFKVRLMEVDAPEPSQAFGKQARLFSKSLLMGNTVNVQFEAVDKYKRLIGQVILPDDRILNQELLRQGLAWHYRVHYPVNENFRELEYRAWKNKAGLWVDPSAVPPWKYRQEPGFKNPPGNSLRMDYDRILSYGLIGDPKTKLYQWPACLNYPKESKGFVVFGNFKEALMSSFKESPNCAGR
jgi:endonuclease YncB( thermonuclease family)